MPLDATIGRVFVLYCHDGCHGHQFWREKLSCGFVKSLFEASAKKTQTTLYSAHQSDKLCRKMARHD